MYQLYTDASCYCDSKRAGWAFLLKMNAATISGSGFLQSKDVNRLELLAVVNGLEAIGGTGVEVVVMTDSLFVINAPNRLKKDKWITPLVIRLRELMSVHKVTFFQLVPGNRPSEHHQVHILARQAALISQYPQKETIE